MKMKNRIYLLVFLVLFICCDSANPSSNTEETLYFPPISGSSWATKNSSDLGWKQTAVQPLLDFLELKHTKGFIVLVNGKIVMENYFNGHTAAETWEWNSAGKTLCASTIGIAQEEGFLNIHNTVSDYLGPGWTSMELEKEKLISVRNLLSMTSGIDDTKQLVIKSNLTYVADAGTRWAYGNVFQKLISVITESTHVNFETYFNEKLKNKIGMEGYWNFGPVFSIYHSNTRSMARFGLLALNNGKWNKEQIINESYFKESTTTSQNINPSYGYLWWLNGKSNYMIPSEQTMYNGALVKNAPLDMYAAMGAKDQRIYVIPSKKMVIVRTGESADLENPTFSLSGFDSALWTKISALFP
jgi:CubicO group peptidase (beta-lactamase class C family)